MSDGSNTCIRSASKSKPGWKQRSSRSIGKSGTDSLEMILDTNALSAAADDDPGLAAVLARAEQMALPVIVLGEYRHGIARSRHRASYENWLAGLLNDCLVLDIQEPTTHHYAEISLELKRKGKPIPTNDLWIAALCRQHSLPLLSRDRHFDLVAGIKRIGW
jgi:tRNA(fMet)-specific endonuclease VapC